MARKAKDSVSPNGRSSVSTSPYGSRLKWVDGYLNDEDRKWLENQRPEVGLWVLKLINAQAGGYKISCSFDSTSSKYCARLIPDDVDCENSGYGLSHRASDPTVALFVLSYKHFVKYEERWSDAEDSSRVDGLWE